MKTLFSFTNIVTGYLTLPVVLKGATVCGVIIIGLFWGLYGLASYGEWRVRSLLSTEKAVPLNGMRLNLSRYVSDDDGLVGADRYLVIVSKDSCTPCQREMPKRVEVLANAEMTPNDRIVLLSTGGLELPTQISAVAARKGIPATPVLLDSTDELKAETGIAWTPHVLILDKEWRIRFSVPRLDNAAASAIVRYFSGPRTR